VLEHVLGALPKFADPNLIVGMETADDAGVYRLADDLAIIHTVDYFTPIVDDPYTFGGIAIANALSDVYSMGGTPRTALNIVLWDKTLPTEVLGDILRGGADMLLRAGCTLVGGHSVDSPELMYGAAVTGTVHPGRVIRNCDAMPGDVLILTKPLGVGILATAAKYDGIGSDELQPAVDSMMTLNDLAAQVMLDHHGRASTDVTGFGLVGHGYEMAKGSGCGLELIANRVPVLDGVLRLINAGTHTRAPGLNRAYVGSLLHCSDGVDSHRAQLMLEAETSGGLLIAFPADHANAALDAMRAAGLAYASVVGTVIDAPAGTVRIV